MKTFFLIILVAACVPATAELKSILIPIQGTEKTVRIRKFIFFTKTVKTAPQRVFRLDLDKHDDRIWVSEDGGQTWKAIFSGRIEKLFLPSSESEVLMAGLRSQLPENRVNLFGYANYSLACSNPNFWQLWIKDSGKLALVSNFLNYYLPWPGDVEKVKILNSKAEMIPGRPNEYQSYYTFSVKGSEGEGTYMFFDNDRFKPVKILNQFTLTHLDPYFKGRSVAFRNPDIPRVINLDDLESERKKAPVDRRQQVPIASTRSAVKLVQASESTFRAPPSSAQKRAEGIELLDDDPEMLEYIAQGSSTKARAFAAKTVQSILLLQFPEVHNLLQDDVEAMTSLARLCLDLGDLWIAKVVDSEYVVRLIADRLEIPADTARGRCSLVLQRTPKNSRTSSSLSKGLNVRFSARRATSDLNLIYRKLQSARKRVLQ